MNWLVESLNEIMEERHRVDPILEMRNTAEQEYKSALISCESIHKIAYRKGKLAALQEVMELSSTGKIPTCNPNAGKKRQGD